MNIKDDFLRWGGRSQKLSCLNPRLERRTCLIRSLRASLTARPHILRFLIEPRLDGFHLFNLASLGRDDFFAKR